ncbi:tRNA lysidine(34) synthetase TilS [Ruminococcus sp.]|uniref:tRNA lysidine(34) synthetase TilS n=1 Tax=Ruminococcus sp. TaxID=41978 RepID=UPI001B53FD7D|nr:tRNA lysidine(34) synthetase TilS [Ruminococcus sp.]MBP5432794.1 tRNA lysidine(34) synthetase TilS [Ruminococcus sp.]
MLDKIYSFIQKYDMLKSGDTVVCGLSGGADSVALLLALFSLKDRLGIQIEALHVNHCLRGAESDRDEQFCRELCKRKAIVFNAVSCDVSGYAEKNSLSVEEAARKLRYSIFEEYSAHKKTATAHNANDALETAILNLARGTGIKGIAGIPPVRGNIIRPLLGVTRAEIEMFLAKEGQDYVTDSTNLSDDYTRNKIRHKIVPLLGELNSSIIETSINSLDTLRDENAFIESVANNAYSSCLKGKKLLNLDKYAPVIRKRLIAKLLSENGLPYSHKRLEEADSVALNGGKLNISGQNYLCGSDGSIELTKIVPENDNLISKPLVIGENRIYAECTLLCEIIQCDDLKKIETVNKNSTFYLLDYDKIRGRTVVRSRKFGDRIKLRGRNFTSSVKKMINEIIPAEKRRTLHFIEDEEGTVFAEMIGIADRTAPDENTVRFLKVCIKRS